MLGFGCGGWAVTMIGPPAVPKATRGHHPKGVFHMAYVSPNCKTKKAVKEALTAGQTIEVFQPGLGTVPLNGPVALEGPHYPKPHTWYGTGTMKDGRLINIK